MNSNVNSFTESENGLATSITLQKADEESALENKLFNNMRELEGFPASSQLKMAFEIHVLQQESADNTSYGILGNLVGAALFNQAQCLLVKLQQSNGFSEL
ncbi:hypothetical protein SAMN05216436_115110 [bacterium A37T11]|nr:hypothetical protein SAMN05216436_115110 [bacterium A37T11]